MNDRSELKICLIEDDEDDYLLLREMLKSFMDNKYVLDWVQEFNDEVLKQLSSKNYDVVIIDHKLDSKDGLDLIEQIRCVCAELPLIFMTDWPDLHTVEQKAKEKGAYAVLSKDSVSGQELVTQIRSAVSQ